MRDGLREVGFELDEAEIERAHRRRANRSAARTWPAPCSARPPTPQRLADEEIDDIGSLIRGYLIEGRPAFRLRETPTVGEAVEAIHDAGGVAIWAHPFWDIEDAERSARRASTASARSASTASRPSTSRTTSSRPSCSPRAAPSSACSSTGSADFHGPENRLFSRFLAFETYGLEPEPRPDRLLMSLIWMSHALQRARRPSSACSR